MCLIHHERVITNLVGVGRQTYARHFVKGVERVRACNFQPWESGVVAVVVVDSGCVRRHCWFQSQGAAAGVRGGWSFTLVAGSVILLIFFQSSILYTFHFFKLQWKNSTRQWGQFDPNKIRCILGVPWRSMVEAAAACCVPRVSRRGPDRALQLITEIVRWCVPGDAGAFIQS